MSRWEYAKAETERVGRMICTTCSQPILSGDFRYRETDDAYLPQHRTCSEQDTGWKKIDRQRQADRTRLQRYLDACLEFKAKWDVDALDEEIDRTQENLARFD
jgi:hypothetical protein